MNTPIQLIVGLGNPGAQYEHTRHNVGAWFIESIVAHFNLTLRIESKFQGRLARLCQGEQVCWLLIPSTYMNQSGLAVQAVAHYYKIDPQAILVAHDELDFPAGDIRLKQSGGHGGHNGLRDIINRLQTSAFNRLRIGIDHPGHRDQVTPYVLGAPSLADKERIDGAIHQALQLMPEFLTGDLQGAFRKLHY